VTRARANPNSEALYNRAMKGVIAHLVVALCVAGTVCADQTIQSVQQALKDQGFYYGDITGDKSAETTAAIRRYQIRNGLQVTGDVNQETLRSLSLNSASSIRDASKYAATQSSGSRPDESSRLPQDSSPHSFGESDRRIEMNPSLAGRSYESSRLLLRPRMVAEVQRQLMIRGYYRGWVDGRYGPRTAFGVRAFQLYAGIPPTGHVDMMTLDALALPAWNLTYLESAPQPDRGWVQVKKFKHGKWKVKWKKYHGHKGDGDAKEDLEGNDSDWWRDRGHDD